MNVERNTCFVIQPFDNDKFDKRYNDTFEPAIRAAGLNPYRVDKDPSVRVPIEEIEKQIRASSICFADITLDNPNVWYELGFAYACDKDVVLVCSEERKDNFPFDIRHKHIIKYKTGSKSDYDSLEREIVQKMQALLNNVCDRGVQALLSTASLIERSFDLKPYELLLLKDILAAQPTDDDFAYLYSLQDSFRRTGHTDLEFSLAIRNLIRCGLVVTSKETVDDWGNTTNVCRVTERGELHIFNHVTSQETIFTDQAGEDDLPF